MAYLAGDGPDERFEIRTNSREMRASSDRTTLSAAQESLEQQIAGLYEITSVLSDRLDPILRPDMDAEKPLLPGNAGPENSRQQNSTWSAVSGISEIRYRLQRLVDRIDL
jgi:hypothetical protein